MLFKECREFNPIDNGTSVSFYFEGCHNVLTDKIERNHDVLLGLTISVLTVMFFSLLLSFALILFPEALML